jgi:hypothetical protein
VTDLTDLLHERIADGRGDIVSLSGLELSLDFMMFMWNYIWSRCNCCGGRAWHYHSEAVQLGPFLFHAVQAVKCDHCDEHGMTKYLGMN